MWNLDLDSLVSDAEANGEKWAVSVQNLSDGSVCEKNGKVSMQSASVIKVFIMATVYDRICYPQNKQTAIYVSEQYDGELRDLLSNMITVSDNDAANRLVELLGNGDFNVGLSMHFAVRTDTVIRISEGDLWIRIRQMTIIPALRIVEKF